MASSALDVAALRAAVAALKGKPELLHQHDLAFLREWLLSMGATLPAPNAPAASAQVGDDADLLDDEVVRLTQPTTPAGGGRTRRRRRDFRTHNLIATAPRRRAGAAGQRPASRDGCA